jgi:hypothetical protein
MNLHHEPKKEKKLHHEPKEKRRNIHGIFIIDLKKEKAFEVFITDLKEKKESWNLHHEPKEKRRKNPLESSIIDLKKRKEIHWSLHH